MRRGPNAIITITKTACSAQIASASWRLAIVVGIMLNLINQGDAIFGSKEIDGPHLLLNFVVPYCVASYSAARNHLLHIRETL